jgi:hypothetical protein
MAQLSISPLEKCEVTVMFGNVFGLYLLQGYEAQNTLFVGNVKAKKPGGSFSNNAHVSGSALIRSKGIRHRNAERPVSVMGMSSPVISLMNRH